MPIYEFHCDACGADFAEMTTISGRDRKLACPKCGSKKTGRKLSSVMVGAGLLIQFLMHLTDFVSRRRLK